MTTTLHPHYESFRKAAAALERGSRADWALRLMRGFCQATTPGGRDDPTALPADPATLRRGLDAVLPPGSLQMRRKGIHFLRVMLASVPELQPVLLAMPRHQRREPDPIRRQRHLYEEDALPRRVERPWVRDLLKLILDHPKSSNWRTSKTAHQTLSLVHNFLRTTGQLEHPSLEAFLAHIQSLTLEAVEDLCRQFTDVLCSASSAKRYIHVFNLLFVDVWEKRTTRFRRVDAVRKRRCRSLRDFDREINSSSGQSLLSADRHRRVDHFNEAEIERLRGAAGHSPRDQLVVDLLLVTGLRRMGLLNVRLEDVAEYKQDRWVARDQGQTLTKGRKHHEFLIDGLGKAAIERWLNTPENLGGRPVTPSGYLLPSAATDNGHMSPSTLAGIFKNVCAQAGFGGDRRAHLHAMRHTHAHALLDSGNDASHIAASLGHASTATTTSVYLRDSIDNRVKNLIRPDAWQHSSEHHVRSPSEVRPPALQPKKQRKKVSAARLLIAERLGDMQHRQMLDGAGQ